MVWRARFSSTSGGTGFEQPMTPGDSFDPRTWHPDDPAPVRADATVREPARERPPLAAQPGRWLGLALSAAILAGGAVAAYETRGDKPAVAAMPAAG